MARPWPTRRKLRGPRRRPDTGACGGWPSQVARLPGRISAGRPWRLVARVAATLALCVAVLTVTGSRPAGPALVTGLLTWLALTAHRDLAPGPTQPQQPGRTGPR